MALPTGESPAWQQVASFVVPKDHADTLGFLTPTKCGLYIWEALHEYQANAEAAQAVGRGPGLARIV